MFWAPRWTNRLRSRSSRCWNTTSPARTWFFGAITMQAGRVAIPDGPGLGVDIDRDIIERYRQR